MILLNSIKKKIVDIFKADLTEVNANDLQEKQFETFINQLTSYEVLMVINSLEYEELIPFIQYYRQLDAYKNLTIKNQLDLDEDLVLMYLTTKQTNLIIPSFLTKAIKNEKFKSLERLIFRVQTMLTLLYSCRFSLTSENCFTNLHSIYFANLSSMRTSYSKFIGLSDSHKNLMVINADSLHLKNCIFKQIKLENSCFDSACIDTTNFDNIDLSNVSFKFATLSNVNINFDEPLENLDFTGAILTKVKFKDGKLHNIIFDGAKCSELDLSGTTLENVSLVNVELSKVNLVGAKLTKITLLKNCTPETTTVALDMLALSVNGYNSLNMPAEVIRARVQEFRQIAVDNLIEMALNMKQQHAISVLQKAYQHEDMFGHRRRRGMIWSMITGLETDSQISLNIMSTVLNAIPTTEFNNASSNDLLEICEIHANNKEKLSERIKIVLAGLTKKDFLLAVAKISIDCLRRKKPSPHEILTSPTSLIKNETFSTLQLTSKVLDLIPDSQKLQVLSMLCKVKFRDLTNKLSEDFINEFNLELKSLVTPTNYVLNQQAGNNNFSSSFLSHFQGNSTPTKKEDDDCQIFNNSDSLPNSKM